MSEERIQRILARAGISSRRKAEELIREARVTVNGQVAGIGDKADPARDAIKVDGKRVHPHEGPFRYLLLNKPRHVMSTVSDPQERKTVMDFVPPTLRKALVPVGRLDFDSEGLIILTDDGEFAQHVAHPRYGGSKTYDVKVKGDPDESQIDRLREGIVLEGVRTLPARIVRRGKGPQRRRGDDDEGHNTWWVVELTQGRTRQIREMFLRIGHPVQKLRRVAIGPLRDPHLPTGAVRELSEREVETLRRITARPKKKKESGEVTPARKAAPVEKAAEGAPAVPGKKKGVKKVPAKKLAAKREAAEAKKAAAKQAPEKKASARKAPARKAPAKRSPAKRSAAKRSPAKRSGPGGGRRSSGAGRGRRS
jgi:23S rRNA pseudouridine2605 synthase